MLGFMAARGMYETVKQAIQDVVAPDLERIKGEITGLRAEVGSVRSELLERNTVISDLFGLKRAQDPAGDRARPD